MEALLDGKINEEEAAHAAEAESHVGRSDLSRSGSAEDPAAGPQPAAADPLGGEIESDGSEPSTWFVQRKLTYWQRVHVWAEEVLEQLQSREWRLVHRLLGHRVDTTYAPEYVRYGTTIRGYIQFLQSIPEKQIAAITFANFKLVVDEVLNSVCRPSKYPPRLVARLLYGILAEFSWAWVGLNEEQHTIGDELFLDAPPGEEPAAAEGTNAAALGYGVRTLRALRRSKDALDYLQDCYGERLRALSEQLSLSALRVPGEHGRVAALQARCIQLRDVLEGHFQLIRQLQVVFPQQLQRANSARNSLDAGKDMEGLKNFNLPSTINVTNLSSQSNQFLKDIEWAYQRLLASIGAVSPLSASIVHLAEAARAATSSHATACIWRIDSASEARFLAALQQYREQRDVCDEQIALIVGHLLSQELELHGGSEPSPVAPEMVSVHSRKGCIAYADLDTRMYRIFANFRFLRLEKTRRVVQSYQRPVSSKINHYIKAIQENYFSVAIAKREATINASLLRCSPTVAHLLWEIHLDECLRECVVRRDYVSEQGWHQLLSLRNVEHEWRLDAALAAFMGYPLSDLVTRELRLGSEVHGCAYALAYLLLLYPEEEMEWSADPHLAVARELVDTRDPGATLAAKDRLLLLGVVQAAKRVRAEIRNIRGTQNTIRERVEASVKAWCEAHRAFVASCETDATGAALCGPVLRVVEATPPPPDAAVAKAPVVHAGVPATVLTPSLRHSFTTSAGRPPLASPTPLIADSFNCVPSAAAMGGRHAYVVDVNFPWEIAVLEQDVRCLEKFGLLAGSMAGPAQAVRDFVHLNEHRHRLATCLVELLKIYYATVDREDEMVALLATEEYQMIQEALFTEGFALRWSDDGQVAQYTQALSEKVQHFVLTMQEVRDKTEAVASKIRSFHLRPFHPEGILQRTTEIARIAAALGLRCVNAHYWARTMQPLLDAALVQQIKYLLQGWTLDFTSMRDDSRYLDTRAQTEVYHLRPLRVRMRVVYKEVKLESQAATWRSYWMGELARYFQWIDVVPRLYNEDDVQKQDVEAAQTQVRQLQQIMRSGCPPEETQRGCVRLLAQLPSYALTEPLHAIEQCISDAVGVEEEWRQSQQFLNLDVGLLQQRLGSDLRKWRSTLQLMRKVTSRLMDYTQPNRLLGGILIVAEDAQMELGRKLDQVTEFTHNKFKDVLEREIEVMYEKVKTERTKLDALDVISTMSDAAAFLSEVPRLKAEMESNEAYVDLMVELEASLVKIGHVFPDAWLHATRVRDDYRSLKELIDRKMKALTARRPFLEQSALDTAATLEAKIRKLDEDVQAIDDGRAQRAPTATQRIIVRLHEEAKTLCDEAKRVAAIQQSLGLAPYDTALIERVLDDTEKMREVWDHVSRALTVIEELGATPFFEVVPRRLHEDLQRLGHDVDNFPPAIRGYRVCGELLETIEHVLACRRFIQDLRSDAMSPLERAQRHWLLLRQQLGANWVLESLRVQDIWDSDPNANAVIYNDVLELAQGERRIEVQLQQINAFWESFQFQLTVYKKHVALVRGWDQVFERLNDDLATFSGMRASPFFTAQQVIALTNESENRLNQLRQILETLLDIQKRWVYLDGIFSGNLEIRAQLPHDTVQFDRASKELLHVMPRPRANGALPEVRAQFFLEDEKLLLTLERISTQLAAVQRALTVYLDTQRRRFPRFFFVGDDDLLEILGNSRDPHFLSKHLRKMFTALASFTVEGTHLVGFSSAEGEDIRYVGSGPVFKDRPLYDWLQDAEQGMVATLRSRTLAAAAELTRAGSVSTAWMNSYPLQVMGLALQLWWTQLQERLFASDAVVTTRAAPRPADKAPLDSPAVAAMEDLLQHLASAVLGANLSVAARHRCEQAITIAVYQRDTSRALVAHQVRSRKDFEWLRVLRLYANSKQEVECHMADAMLVHGFEYGGAYDRLVQTPLTDKCYLTLMQAIHTRLGGSPVGPAGTGKTETVKALGGADRPTRARLQLRRHVRLPGGQPHPPRALPGRRVGLLRRVQPPRGAHHLGAVASRF
ncbi:dynein heavy chain 1, cytosolic [Strigomonas culicis]|uniref:Dynein heavy chain 1, cytosolic n=1 Tax=Strigomonas culicis TaxID=28005 RepID=S9TWV8_9TRYP|nr:dynein heavy chain 1, cytosolic [Strigomonas culicis]|eukprot:EPY22982.1 dynein heavy chain 1, cytosolic [Strigomonas culicis]